MDWFDRQDSTPEVIDPREHARVIAERTGVPPPRISRNLLIIETGRVLNHLCETYKDCLEWDPNPLHCALGKYPICRIRRKTEVTIIEKPVSGPVAVDAFETARALGAGRLFVLSVCGAWPPERNIGDFIIPREVVREEGTSYHYLEAGRNAVPDTPMYEALVEHLKAQGKPRVHTGTTVSTDAIFRETVRKERSWRERGILGVEMEMSPLLAAAAYRNVPAVGMLVVSDLHWLDEKPQWKQGGEEYRAAKCRAGELLVEFARKYRS